MAAETEYIVVLQRAWMNDSGHGVNYSSDLARFPNRAAAIRHGFGSGESDDFNIATVKGGAIVAFGWMDKDFGDDEDGEPHGGYDLVEIARAIYLRGAP